MIGALTLAGCNSRRPATVGGGIVSLTPAGTDLLIAMGLAPRIVGVSAFEPNPAMRSKLPKVGDYLRIDWERITSLQPSFMLVQGKRDRLPPGVREKSQELGITPIILQIDRLLDIDAAIKQIGDAIGDAAAASKVIADLAARRAALAAQAVHPPVPALIVISDSGTQVVGHNTFIDDALALAGGDNVLAGNGYLAIDREKLVSLEPKVVFLILPAADANAVERGKTSLATAGLSADAKVVPITNGDALMPGTSAYRLANTMAAALKATP